MKFTIQLFGGLAERYATSFSFLKEALRKADIKLSLRSYLSFVFSFTLFSYFLTLISLTLIFYFLQIEFPLIMKIAYVLFIPILVSGVSLFFFIYYPIQKAAARAKNIEVNLPFVLTHMSAIARSGIPPYVAFKLISRFGEYGEITKEFGKIVRNIEVFGMDPVTAVKEVAERTPSEGLKQALLGFVSTTEAGGDVRAYLKSVGEQALFEWKMKREKFLQQLSAYAEFYTGILIAAPLFIISLFAVMNMIQPTIAGYDILFLTRLSIYLLVPILNIGFLLFLKGVEVEI